MSKFTQEELQTIKLFLTLVTTDSLHKFEELEWYRQDEIKDYAEKALEKVKDIELPCGLQEIIDK